MVTKYVMREVGTLAKPPICECERDSHVAHCRNEGRTAVYFPGAGTFALCDSCIAEYEHAGFEMQNELFRGEE